MEFLDDIFRDLIDDINKWHRSVDDTAIVSELEDLKQILQDKIDEIDTEIKYQEQDKSFALVDELIEEEKIEEYEKYRM